MSLERRDLRTFWPEEADLVPIWVGTDANLTLRGGSPRVEYEAEGPFDVPEEGPEQLEERLR